MAKALSLRKSDDPSGRIRRLTLAVWVGAGLALASFPLPAASAADSPRAEAAGADPAGPPATPPVPTVALERLFELPSGFEAGPSETRRGDGEAEWRRRFAEARAAVERSGDELAQSKRELANLAEESNAWTLAPPVGGAQAAASEAPLSYELRQRIKRQEAAAADAKQHLVKLEVEANLAGVPENWRY